MQLYFVFAIIFISTYVYADLSVKLTTKSEKVNTKQDVQVNLQYTNNGKDTLNIYKRAIPTNGQLKTNMFAVSVNGKTVNYVGPVAKISTQAANAIISLEPGKSINVDITLSPSHDMRISGTYTIRYNMHSHKVLQSTSAKKVIVSNIIKVNVEGRSNVFLAESDRLAKISPEMAANDTETDLIDGNPTFVDCHSDQKAAIKEGVEEGRKYADQSLDYLNENKPKGKTPRFRTWFGNESVAVQTKNWNAVKKNFRNIRDALANKPKHYDCSCINDPDPEKKDFFAYVYSHRPYYIYLCGSFFNAQPSGQDSQGGTMVHETAHFEVVAGANDNAYGHELCQELAKDEPKKAVNNADSHEFFAENVDPTLD